MIDHLLNRTFAVHRPVMSDDGSGGQQLTWQCQGEVSMRVSQPSASDRYAAMQAGAALDAHLYGEPDSDVRRGDELRGEGETYAVIATISPSKPSTYLRADCQRIQREGDD